MTALTVAAYNVGFGDAILVAVPERTRRTTVVRHILIDVGNVLGGDAEVFGTVMQDVLRRLDGRPIDLYVMTHEHMDHVQGLLRAHSGKQRLPAVDYAWLTGSAHPRYGQRFPEARKQIDLYRAAFDRVRIAAIQRGLLGLTPVRAFLANNDPRSTGECVAFPRKIACKRTYYVDRSFTPVPGEKSLLPRRATFDLGTGARHVGVLRSHAAGCAGPARSWAAAEADARAGGRAAGRARCAADVCGVRAGRQYAGNRPGG